MIKERAMELVAALRSGRYKQGKGWLRNGNAFCCLGVACDLYNSTNWVECIEGQGWFSYGGLNDTDMLSKEVQEYFGFNSPSGRTIDCSTIVRACNNLVGANDNGATFTELADYIEANWENL